VKSVGVKLKLRHRERGSEVVCGRKSVGVRVNPEGVNLEGVDILAFQGNGDPKEWLKKRHLPETVDSPEDSFLIQEVPDILWVHSGRNRAESYKGVLIVETSVGTEAEVDMVSKEVGFGLVES
jgi:DNA polymerase II small subunit/DNA polymerase delta subunit B